MTFDNWTQLDLFENTEDRGSLQEASPVNRGPLPESEKDIRISKTVTSGRKCFESFQISHQNSSLERMCLDLLTFPWESNARTLTWKRNTKSQHLIFQLVPSRFPTKEKESGSSPSENLWATPNTLDHLPPRSEESTRRMQTVHRKGRTRPPNLREQVDPATMNMYPTPTTKGFGHASEGQTLIFRRLVEEGKMTEEEAQQMMNGTTLRPPRMKEWMWPTPNSRDWKDSMNTVPPSVGKTRGYTLGMKVAEERNKLWPTPRATQPKKKGAIEINDKGRRISKNGRDYGLNLEESVEFWPTPTTQDNHHDNMELNEKGRRISKDGKNDHSLNLADRVQLWPTPTVQDSNKATKKWREDHQNNLTAAVFNPNKLWPTPTHDDGKNVKLNPNRRQGLYQVVQYWPTPTTRDWKGGYPGGRIRNGKVSKDTLDVTVQFTDNKEKKKVQLNPEWVSVFLMGYPRHWMKGSSE